MKFTWSDHEKIDICLGKRMKSHTRLVTLYSNMPLRRCAKYKYEYGYASVCIGLAQRAIYHIHYFLGEKFETRSRTPHSLNTYCVHTKKKKATSRSERERWRERDAEHINMRLALPFCVCWCVDGWQWTWNDNGIIMQIDIIWRNRETAHKHTLTLARTCSHSLSSSFSWWFTVEHFPSITIKSFRINYHRFVSFGDKDLCCSLFWRVSNWKKRWKSCPITVETDLAAKHFQMLTKYIDWMPVSFTNHSRLKWLQYFDYF